MKENGDRSMRTIGSLTLCRSLLEAGLVDRFRVVTFAVTTGDLSAPSLLSDPPTTPATRSTHMTTLTA